MEGNDLGADFYRHIVVVLEPLLMSPRKRTLPYVGKFKADKIADSYQINGEMLQWIVYYARQYSVPARIWSFLPVEIYDRLLPRIDRVIGDYVSQHQRFAHPTEAYQVLRANPDIIAIYDADPYRLEHFWHFRGVSVLEGTHP